MGEQKQQIDDKRDVSEKKIIEKLIKSRYKELAETFKKKETDANYGKSWKEFINDIAKGYRQKINKFFKNIGYEKNAFRDKDGNYYYPEIVALVLETYLGKEFKPKQLRSEFQTQKYGSVKYTERNEFFLEIYDALIEKYKNTDKIKKLINERSILEQQYEAYSEFYQEIDARIIEFGDKMRRLVKEVIPKATGITGISEEIFMPELQGLMQEPTLESIKEIAQIKDLDSHKAIVSNKIDDAKRVYPPRITIFREDAKIIMDSLENLFESARKEWEDEFVPYFKEQRIIELEKEFNKEANDFVEIIESDDYLTTYFKVDKEAMLTPDEMGQFVLLRTFFKRKEDLDVPEDVGGLFYHWDIDREKLLNVLFKGLKITKENDPKGIIRNLKNISDLDEDSAQLLFDQIEEYNTLEGDAQEDSDFGKAIRKIFYHRSWDDYMMIEDLINFLRWTLDDGYFK